MMLHFHVSYNKVAVFDVLYVSDADALEVLRRCAI